MRGVDGSDVDWAVGSDRWFGGKVKVCGRVCVGGVCGVCVEFKWKKWNVGWVVWF